MSCKIGYLPALPPTWADSMEHNCRQKGKLPLFELGWTALHSACARAQYSCIQLLLATGANPCACDFIGRTPLDVVGAAHYSGHKIDIHDFRQTIRILIAAGAKISNNRVRDSLYASTPLHIAVELASKDAVEELLEAGASPICINSKGITPMHICVNKRLKEMLQLLINYETENRNDSLATVDAKDKDGQSVLHTAVRTKWADGVVIALGANANVFMMANYGESPLHSAAAVGDVHIFQQILNVAKYNIDFPNKKGQTALYLAVDHNHIDIVKILIENGASINVTLPNSQSVLDVAARHGFVNILDYILKCEKQTSLKNNLCSSYTPLIHATVSNQPACVELLLRKSNQLVPFEDKIFDKNVYTTVLRIAAAKNYLAVAELIVRFDSQTINEPTRTGFSPLHEACIYGNREIVTLFINNGADLSRQAKHTKIKCTPIDMLMDNVPVPVTYMEEVFDSCITIQGKNLQDRECFIIVNYDILMPNPNGSQMAVIKALVSTGNRYGQRKLLQHPLVESFLYLKWRALLPFFYTTIAFYALFVLCLNVYVVSVFYYEDKNRQNLKNVSVSLLNTPYPIKKPPVYFNSDIWKYMVYVTAILITLQEMIFINIKNKRYFEYLETWIKFGSIILAMFLPSVVFWHTENIVRNGNDDEVINWCPEWVRLIATIDLMLSWLELMFLLSRLPSWGYYTMMFAKVAMQVLKVMSTFGVLIIGFSLCFLIQFRSVPPFDGPWASFTKTLVMMTSEFDYEKIINKENVKNIDASLTILRVMFLIFVILASVVLMNFMVGIAVNDVNTLKQIGKQKRLERQVEFLASLDDVVYRKYLRELFWRKFYSPCFVQNLVSKIKLRPRAASCIYNKILPTHIREAIYKKAQTEGKALDNVLRIKLDEIHDAIILQDKHLDHTKRTVTTFNGNFDKINRQVEDLRNEISLLKKLLSDRGFYRN